MSVKKTNNISKYSIKWQLLRSSIKGSKTSCVDKINLVLNYLSEEETVDAWERVYNFLEGLQRGYIGCSNLENIEKIQIALDHLLVEKNNYLIHKQLDVIEELRTLNLASFQQRYLLYKDLFVRSKKWLLSGYYHQEQENFIDFLYSSFDNDLQKISDNYNYSKLLDLRKASKFIKNKHQFFF